MDKPTRNLVLGLIWAGAVLVSALLAYLWIDRGVRLPAWPWWLR